MSGGFPIGPELCNSTAQGINLAASLGTAITCGNNAYGSYTQLVSSTAHDASWILISLQANASSLVGYQASASIAIGAASSELVIANNLIVGAYAGGWNASNFLFPISIPAGTRISAAGYETWGTSTIYVGVTIFDSSFCDLSGCSGVDSIGWASGKGTSVTGGGANTMGAYSQLTSATPRDYGGFTVMIDSLNAAPGANATVAYIFDIAIGASGSELVILQNYEIGEFNLMAPSPFFPIPIPSGTRVAVRSQKPGTSIAQGVTLYGAYQ